MREGRQSGPKGIVTLLFIGLTIAYPVIVYFHIESVRPQWFASVMLALVVLRFIFFGGAKRLSDAFMAVLAIVFCLAVMLFDSALLLKFYPVMMNVGMGLLFLVSLNDSQSLIERFARAGGKTPPEQAKGYLRGLSLTWGVLLLLNGAVSAYTAWFTSLSTWALYNGMIAYMLIACFVLLELGYRSYYKKRHNIVDE